MEKEKEFVVAAGQGPVIISTDLDGTTIESDATVNPEVAEAFRLAWRAGVALIINSDTSLEGLRRHQHRMGLQPEWVAGVIAENGAFMRCRPGSGLPETVNFASFSQRSSEFVKFRQELTDELIRLGFDVVLTHPATTVRRLERYPPLVGKVAFLDVTRQVSFTSEIRRLEPDGSWAIDPELMRETGALVRTVAERFWSVGLLDNDDRPRPEVGHDEGWLDLCGFGLTKAAPLRVLVETGRPIYHIGDGSNDKAAAAVPGVVVIAVGPTCSLARSGRAHFVTEQLGTRGFVEAVDLILRHHCEPPATM
jgi:hypothetical protein